MEAIKIYDPRDIVYVRAYYISKIFNHNDKPLSRDHLIEGLTRYKMDPVREFSNILTGNFILPQNTKTGEVNYIPNLLLVRRLAEEWEDELQERLDVRINREVIRSFTKNLKHKSPVT